MNFLAAAQSPAYKAGPEMHELARFTGVGMDPLILMTSVSTGFLGNSDRPLLRILAEASMGYAFTDQARPFMKADLL